MEPHICCRDLATSPKHTYEISRVTSKTHCSHISDALAVTPAIPASPLCPHGLGCYKSTVSAQGEARALHRTWGTGSPKRVLCPKQPHLRVTQPKPHTVAAAPSHDEAQTRDAVHASGSLLSATRQAAHKSHSWVSTLTTAGLSAGHC